VNTTLAPFDTLVADHGAVVLRVLTAMVGRHSADDCWQETFLAALRVYDTVGPLDNPRGWLLTIAHRKAIDMARSDSRRSALTESVTQADGQQAAVEPDPAALVVTSLADATELRPLLRQLPPKQQLAVVYRYIGDMAYDDIATLLACSPAAARRSVFEGIQKLRISLSNKEGRTHE
jgi:RNA polymerase sigma factor (sigma-70 family)